MQANAETNQLLFIEGVEREGIQELDDRFFLGCLLSIRQPPIGITDRSCCRHRAAGFVRIPHGLCRTCRPTSMRGRSFAWREQAAGAAIAPADWLESLFRNTPSLFCSPRSPCK